MTDTEQTTTDEQSEPTTFGSGVDAQILADSAKTYNQAVEEAQRVRNAARNALRDKRSAATTSVRNLMSEAEADYDTAEALVSMINAMTRDAVRKQQNEVDRVYNQAVEHARSVKDAAISSDPFAKYVHTTIRRNHGDSYADDLLRDMPYTFESLRAKAQERGWCGDYESAMAAATEAGALPEETITVEHPVDTRYHTHNVPSRLNPKVGETWVLKATYPAYARIYDADGNLRDYGYISYYTVGEVEFVKKADAPAEETSDQD